MRIRLGPTGEFPDGKIRRDDEGQIRLAITHREGNVIIAFGSPVAWIGFDPEQARQIAALLIEHAEKAVS